MTATTSAPTAASPSNRLRLTQTEPVIDAIDFEMRRDERVLYIDSSRWPIF